MSNRRENTRNTIHRYFLFSNRNSFELQTELNQEINENLAHLSK